MFLKARMRKSVLICLCLVSLLAEAAHLVSRRTVQGRIIGGTVANAGEFPFAAAIYKQTDTGNYFCTGVLVTHQWILTAGQCAEGATLFTIRLGSNSLNDSNAVRVATDQYFLHPDFNGFDNDIALIKLRLPVELTDYIKIVTLYAGPITDYLSVMTFGWGQISDNTAGPVDALSYVLLTTLTDSECRLTYGNVITENMVCAEGNYNEGTCRGDLGSPLLLYRSSISSTALLGISSFISANGCESTDPSGFTKLLPYMEWIFNVMSEN